MRADAPEKQKGAPVTGALLSFMNIDHDHYKLYNNSLMREKRPTHPIERKDRLLYGAVPLDPWTASEERRGFLRRKKRESYLAASVLRISNRIDSSIDTAVGRYGWTDSAERRAQLKGVIESSLYDSQRRRLELNPNTLLQAEALGGDERFERAKNGTATPGDLLTFLIDHPKLGSLEIAKLTHPLDMEASEEMDGEVMFTLARLGFNFTDEAGRYKTKSVKPEIPAITVLRKQTVAELELPEGLVQVVQRRAFLVRGDEEARSENDIYLDRMVVNPDRHDEVYEKIETWYPYHRQLPVERERARKWLQPLATSYYAKIVDLPNEPTLDV